MQTVLYDMLDSGQSRAANAVHRAHIEIDAMRAVKADDEKARLRKVLEAAAPYSRNGASALAMMAEVAPFPNKPPIAQDLADAAAELAAIGAHASAESLRQLRLDLLRERTRRVDEVYHLYAALDLVQSGASNSEVRRWTQMARTPGQRITANDGTVIW